MKSEQQRISQELVTAEVCLGDSQDRLERAILNLNQGLELIGDCHRAYSIADSQVRRQFNQAIFTALYVEDDDTIRSELAAPFALLLDPRLRGATTAERGTKEQDRIPQRPALALIRTDGETNQPAPLHQVGGWNIDYLVELLGRY